MKFKSHIQGLRALSVISVLIYHLEISLFDFDLFRGGFLGVDIFFVISGYLISSIILKDFENETFSFKNFYIKRIKRLFPALFFLIFIVTFFAIITLDIKSFNEFKETTYSSLLFYSNFLFWTQDAYSAEPSRLKYLLHTWSLSIEEQFYLFFPLFIFISLKLRNFSKIILSIFLISLILSTVLSIISPKANFFLMPTRIWEFLAGTLAYIFRERLNNSFSKFKPYFFDLLFFILICFIFFFKIDLYHPSIITFVPVLITTVLILNENNKCISNFILNNKLSIFLGNISYSLYLWHFPILVYLRYNNLENSLFHLSIAIILIFIFSIMSYFFIESYFRKTNDSRSISIILSFLFLIIGTNIFLTKTINTNEFFIKSQSFNIKEEKERRWSTYKTYCDKNNVCKFDEVSNYVTKNIIFVGDSLVPDSINLMRLKKNDNVNFIENTSGGCPPIQSIEKIPKFVPDRKKCIELNKERFNESFYNEVDAVIINNLMGWYTYEDLEKYLLYLKKIGIEKIIVIGNYIVLKQDILKTFTIKDAFLKNFNFRENFKISNSLLFDDVLRDKSKKLDFLYISFSDLCKNNECEYTDYNDFPFTLDQFHLSYQFSQYVSKKLNIKERVIKYIND